MGVINNWDYETFEKTWIRDSESFEEWIAAYRLY
jgi:hypothetical protein